MDRFNGQRWHELFSEREKILAYHREPYLAAVVPYITDAIKTQKKPVKILVVGGGRGHFSTDVLPAVRAALEKQGHQHPIEAVETDLTDEIMKAPGQKKVANVLELSKHFKPGEFDIVIGESMIHQVHRHITKALKEIKTVLGPKGIFLHVQDTIPDHEIWLSKETIRKHGIDPKAARLNVHFSLLPELAQEAHGNLLEALRGGAVEAGLYMREIPVSKQCVMGSGLPDRHPTLELGDRNHVTYEIGNVFGGRAQGLPPGKKLVGYGGIITLFMKS